jgi:hypothetical protein
MHRIKSGHLLLLLSSFWIAGTTSAIPIGIGYSVTEVSTPDRVVGDAVVAGDAIFVGAGSFGDQSLYRIDSDGTTMLASGFSSMGGMAYDAANDRLLFGDNGLEFSSSGSGDTLYALENARTTSGGSSASSLEVFGAGTIPNFADVAIDPNDPTGMTIFISDATGPPGEILRADIDIASLLAVQAISPFAAGLAASSSTLFAGSSDYPPVGHVFATALPGGDGLFDPLAIGLPGQYDLEMSADGTLLATSQDQLLRLDPVTGLVLEVIATGFSFAGGLHEADGVIYAIDSDFGAGTSNVFAFTPIPEPGAILLMMLGLAGLAARRRSG